ncbi:hypothetical protein Mgra_00002871 [Meloidogyne graminicola]|uniref:Activin_recp domain-containing protein n=1 Tax=Meloidogyne graminicola TaxID=189291 RepID=A0A8S9ZWU5_9BILA|nr:hypothetical protein Mgra_00002871 [Meloidogyne graminicola]
MLINLNKIEDLIKIFLIIILFSQNTKSERLGHLTCYKNNGFDLGIEEVRCSPSISSSPIYCLKANVYDGRVVRDCATSTQCPQGNACSPINYEEDGTTDFVCCCQDDLCNSSMKNIKNNFCLLFTIIILSFIIILIF